MRLSFSVLAISASFCLTGCILATTRTTLDVFAPTTHTTSQSSEKEVFVTPLVDKRVFETRPRRSDTPSLDPSEDNSRDVELRAIGRKRNGFGKALGDFVMAEGQTVAAVVTESVRRSFEESGYRVLSDPNRITPNTYIVDGSVEKFWLYNNLGGFKIDVETKLSIKSPDGSSIEKTTSITRGNDSSFIVYKGERDGVAFTDALRVYMDKLVSQISE